MTLADLQVGQDAVLRAIGGKGELRHHLLDMGLTPGTALVFLVFTLLYTPCVAAIAAARRELGSKRAAAGVVLMQCGIAWAAAFAVHTLLLAVGVV